MSDKVKIKFISWRNGRPRFSPGPGLRVLGYEPKDLKHDDGRWFTKGEAVDWSDKFEKTKKAADENDAKQKQTFPPAPVKPKGTYPISQLAKEWLASPRLSARRKAVSPATLKDYKQKIEVLSKFDPDLWASEVEALDYPTCYGIYEELLEEKGISTARGTMGALGRAIKWAMKRGKVKLKVNPARDLDMLTPDPRARFITPKEFDMLVWAAEKKLERIDAADMLYCGVWTGQRQADRLGLMKSAIRNRRFVVRQGKTNAIVNPPVSDTYWARIEAGYRRHQAASVTSVYVHLNEATWEKWNHYTYRQLFRKIRAAAGKRMPSCKTIMEKDLRATAVTWLALAGATIAEICAITGHSLKTATEILKHYLALHPEMATSAIGKMVEWLESGANIDMAV